jgi:hypothetical protein
LVIDIYQRIRAIERALRDVIIPAIDPQRANAVEQAGYCLRHLNLVATQCQWEYPFVLAELRDFLELTRTLQGIAGASAPAAVREQASGAEAAAGEFAPLRLPGMTTVRQAVTGLRQAADELLKAALDAGPEARSAAGAAVVDMARRREIREGAWIRGQGYDSAPGGGPDIAGALEF